MLSEDKYFRTLSRDELWHRYCGFLDLSIDEFMEIQKELLMDEIKLVAGSTLGKKIMGKRIPKSIEEFRRLVPLTTYEDYEPYLSERREDALAVKPDMWCHSTGRSGSYKWVPHSHEGVERAARWFLGSGVLACCSKRGEINIGPGMRFLTIFAPPPYTSGSLARALTQRFSVRMIPTPEQIEASSFLEAIKLGFQTGMKDGVDMIGAIASIMVRMGKEISQQTSGTRLSISMMHPKIILRLVQAWIRSKKEKRPILPKDLWRPKGVLVAGLDTSIYKDDVAYYWGSIPYEIYVSTEGLIHAMQSWNKEGLVFVPDVTFLEFIPYEELLEHQDDKEYQASTVLLNHLEEGKSYEVVITQLFGSPLLRYRMKDIVKVITMKDSETGINLPHVVFQHRIGETIDLAGLARLDEKIIWQAIVNTGIDYTEWIACKEYDGSQSFIRFYIELKKEKAAAEIETMIDEQLKIVDTNYQDIHSHLGLQPVRVTLLSAGTFQRYGQEKVREGASLAQLKPTHMNPPGEIIKSLLKLSEVSTNK